MKLRIRWHLGHLRVQQWMALIAGAKQHGYLVYLATPRSNLIASQTINVLRFSTDASTAVLAYSSIITKSNFKNGRFTATRWAENAHSRPSVNNSITPTSRLVLSPTDYTQYGRGADIVRGLGLEDVFE